DGERGRRRRLADAAAADTQQDAAGLEQLCERRRHAASPAEAASSATSAESPAGSSGAVKTKGRRTGVSWSARRSAVIWVSAWPRRASWRRAARRYGCSPSAASRRSSPSMSARAKRRGGKAFTIGG